MKLREFVKEFGQPYSQMLGVDLKSCKNTEILKWFVASILYAKPIRESSATKTFELFQKRRVLTPKTILKTGWDGLVSILDEGGYTRYDFSTADKMLDIFGNLQKNYGGDLNLLHTSASDSSDLEERIMSLGKGIGETTVSIFLRDMRGVWPKANPKPSPLVEMAMQHLGISDLQKFAKSRRIDVVRLETALLRLGKDYIKKGKKIDVDTN